MATIYPSRLCSHCCYRNVAQGGKPAREGLCGKCYNDAVISGRILSPLYSPMLHEYMKMPPSAARYEYLKSQGREELISPADAEAHARWADD